MPRTAVYAALALGLIMLGGMGTHVVHGQPAHIISHEAAPLAALLFVVWLRRRLRPKPAAE